MAEPKKEEALYDAPKPEAKSKPKPEADAKAELAAAKAQLAELESAKELELTKAKIAAVRADLAKQAARDRASRSADERREKTAKEGDLALYVVNERSYKPLRPGEPSGLIEKGTIIRVKADVIPGASMLAVEPAASPKLDQFRALKV